MTQHHFLERRCGNRKMLVRLFWHSLSTTAGRPLQLDWVICQVIWWLHQHPSKRPQGGRRARMLLFNCEDDFTSPSQLFLQFIFDFSAGDDCVSLKWLIAIIATFYYLFWPSSQIGRPECNHMLLALSITKRLRSVQCMLRTIGSDDEFFFGAPKGGCTGWKLPFINPSNVCALAADDDRPTMLSDLLLTRLSDVIEILESTADGWIFLQQNHCWT